MAYKASCEAAGSRLHEMSKNTFETYKETWLKECDYVAEAGHLRKYRQLFDADPEHATLAACFDVPAPIAPLCAERVLGMSYMEVQDQIAPFYWVRLGSGVLVVIAALMFLWSVFGPVRERRKVAREGRAASLQAAE